VGGFRVEHTPGHASHHVAYLHEQTGWAFVGDVGGVRIPPSEYVLPPTPPPDIDVGAWESSLRIVSGWSPACLGLTHFGAFADVRRQLEAVADGLHELVRLAGRTGADAFAAALSARLAEVADPATAAAYLQAAPPDQLWQGLDRYRRNTDPDPGEAPSSPRNGEPDYPSRR
jgi:hypothetical protein